MKLLIQVAADAAWNYDLVIHSPSPPPPPPPPPKPTLDKQRNQLMLLACVHFQRELGYEIQPNSVRENWPPY